MVGQQVEQPMRGDRVLGAGGDDRRPEPWGGRDDLGARRGGTARRLGAEQGDGVGRVRIGEQEAHGGDRPIGGT